MRSAYLIALSCLAACGPASAQAPAAYRSIQLVGGGHLVLKPGASAEAKLVRGDPRFTRILQEGGGRLKIENCRPRCPRGYEAEVEVTSPRLAALAVSDGGTLEVGRGFPPQPALALAVHDGGAVDARAIVADQITAAVADGGRILVRAEGDLNAVVADGGAITYWGRPRLHTQVTHGGVIRPGRPADIGLSLAELMPPPKPPAPIPPIPPIPEPPGMVAPPVPPTPPTPPQPW